MKRFVCILCCALFLFAALLGSSALQSRAEEDSPETDPGGGSEISWTLGRDSERVETDRLGVTEGGIMPRSAVGSLCTISYGGKTAEVTVDVKISGVNKIEVDNYKNTYTEGESFDPNGMKVTVIYADGKNKIIESITNNGNQGVTWDPAGPLTKEIDSVKITYTDPDQEKGFASANVSVTVQAKPVTLESITVSGTSYTAAISKLSPATVYQYRVVVDGATVSEGTFKTTEAIPLADGSFDNWHQSGKLWNPWDINGTSFWDTGNRGATTISESNTTPTSETCNGSGQAASLESKYLLVKFAAGSMFAGSYLRTEGTNGVLSFGRPFAAFPTKLRVNYKYTPAVIDKVGETAFANLKGKSDSCYIYVALTDWDEPREIRTSQSNRQLFDKNDPHIIAYAELIRGDAMSSYEQKDLTLEYRSFDRTPKYIVVVATSSKYGDYFTGGVGSKLLLDNFELIYE